jgi:hypothetical protein
MLHAMMHGCPSRAMRLYFPQHRRLATITYHGINSGTEERMPD